MEKISAPKPGYDPFPKWLRYEVEERPSMPSYHHPDAYYSGAAVAESQGSGANFKIAS